MEFLAFSGSTAPLSAASAEDHAECAGLDVRKHIRTSLPLDIRGKVAKDKLWRVDAPNAPNGLAGDPNGP